MCVCIGLSAAPVSIYDCLDLFTKREQLGKNDLWYCPRCREHKAATKKFDLWHLPPVLIIHLKRFYSTSAYYRHKNSTLVRAPLENLDLSRYVVSPEAPRTVQRTQLNGPFGSTINEGEALYDLVAVSDHGGGLYGGHYTASCRNHRNGLWYEFNDSHVSPIHDESSIVTEQAYLLIYQRRSVTNLISSLNAQPLYTQNAAAANSQSNSASSEPARNVRYYTRSQAASANAQSSLSSSINSPSFRNEIPAFDSSLQPSTNGGAASASASASQSQSAQNSRAASPKLAPNGSPRVAPTNVGAKTQSNAHSQSTSNLPTATGGSTPQTANNMFSSSPSSSSSASVASSVSTIVDRNELTARNLATSAAQSGVIGVSTSDIGSTVKTPRNGGTDDGNDDADDEAEYDGTQPSLNAEALHASGGAIDDDISLDNKQRGAVNITNEADNPSDVIMNGASNAVESMQE